MVVLKSADFKRAVIEYLEMKDMNDLASIMKSCDFELTDTGRYTYNVWDQTSLHLEVRVPIPMMKQVESMWLELKEMFVEIYPTDKYHDLMTIEKKIKIMQSSQFVDDDGAEVMTSGVQVYHNLITKVHKKHMDVIEKDYILEGCSCALNGNRLAAAAPQKDCYCSYVKRIYNI